MSSTKFEAERFNGKSDFGLWQIKMKAMLIQQGLDDALIGEEALPESATKIEKEKILLKAHSAIILCLGDKVLREVKEEKTAAGVWAKLESLYMTKSLANRSYMKQRLYSLKFSEEKGIEDQMDEFNKSIDDLESVDAKLEDEDKAILLLNALPKSYEHIKDAMLYGRESTITLEEVQNALRAKELQKSNEAKREAGYEALNVNKFKAGKSKKPSHEGKKGNQGKAKNHEGKETRKCHYCKKPGHLKKDCYSWKKKQSEKAQATNSAESAEELETAEMLNVVSGKVEQHWILDSGCSFHMSPQREWFYNFKELNQGSVLLGNDQVCPVKGIGNIKLRLHDGSVKILPEVRFIPDLKRNLISLGSLELKGYNWKSENGWLYILKNSEVVMKGVRRSSLYYLIAETLVGDCDFVSKDDYMMWHARLGHVGERGLHELVKQNLISITGRVEKSSCEHCILGKSKKQPFGIGTHLSKSPLEYAHADLWGPARNESLGGGKFFLSIMDDFSRKLWIYILKQKSEAFSKFKEWCTSVELEKGTTIKCLRTDNGLEFLSTEFNVYCKNKGIQRHRTVPGTPQQNGVIERMNRTILERVRCMLLSSGVSKRFWGEAVTTAAILINRCPSSAVGFKTPDQLWYGRTPSYSHLRIFGCQAYAHLKGDKLDARAIKCIMLGYQEGTKGYRLWCYESGMNKIFISRDVVFKEEVMPFLEMSKVSREVSFQDKPPDTQVKVELMKENTKPAQGIADNDNEEADPIAENGQSGREDLSDYLLARDRVRRQIRPPTRFAEADMVSYALTVAEETEYQEPQTYSEAINSNEREQWVLAMREELNSLETNGTWTLVKRPTDHKLVTCKWIFKKKLEVAGDKEMVRFKARLVARGFSQREGIDFNEIFSPVVKHCSIRILLALVAQEDLILEQLDVKTAFLHGNLEETIYMSQPEGFILPENQDKVCLLKKSLYGLKQSPRQWYKRFDEEMQNIGYLKSKHDSCVYIKRNKGTVVSYLLLYVDDMLVASSSQVEIDLVKKELQSRFEMKMLGEARRILGMDIKRDKARGTLWLFQQDYILKVLKKFRMHESKVVSIPLGQHLKLTEEQKPKDDEERREMQSIPYANAVGSIMYTMICTRPDLSHAISVISRYMADPGRYHWEAMKWIFRYLKGAAGYGILFRKVENFKGKPLRGYVDSDYAANLDSRKSQTGYIFTLYGAAVSWRSMLQSVVALSTTEAEYMAVTEAVKEALWLKGMIAEFGIDQDTVDISCDSQSAIHLVKHQVFHERSKHIDVRYHFVRDVVNQGKVRIVKVSTDENAADMLTKTLPSTKFKYCLELVSIAPQV